MESSPLSINALSESTIVIPGSKQVFRSELDLFQIPNSDTSVLSSTELVIDPLNSIKDEGPIIINVPSQTERYLDPSSAYLYIQAKITNLNGTAIPATANVAPASYFYHLLFSQVDISLNNTIITENCPCYPFRSMMKLLVTTNKAQENSLATAQLSYRDTKINDHTTANKGFVKRKDIASGSKVFELIGDIKSSIFQQSRFILPGVNMQIKLIRSSADFSLESDTVVAEVTGCPYKVALEKVQLHIKAHEIHPEVMSMHRSLFNRNMTAKYPFMDSKLAISQIKTGSLTHLSHQLFQGKLPTYLIVGFVDAAAMNGDYKKCSMDFSTHDLDYIKVKVDNPNIKYTCFKTDYTNNLYLQAFKAMENALVDPSLGTVVDRDTYKNYNFYVFHLIPNIAHNLSPQYNGVLRIECGFTKTSETPFNLLALGFSQNILEINKDLNIQIN